MNTPPALRHSRSLDAPARSLTRREFLQGVALGACAAACPAPTTAAAASTPGVEFGRYRICYNNFAAHLLNAYNPNVYYPGLPHRWSNDDWFRFVDMLADFGFNVFQYWLEPRLFCSEALKTELARDFTAQFNAIIDHAHRRGLRVHGIAGLATVGADWRTLCPNEPEAWRELRRLWNEWSKRLPEQDVFGLFPGDPGACSRNGCTAETFIDRAVDVAEIIRHNCPRAVVELNTWGPPFFGWGNIEGPAGWRGEFIPSYQHTAWRFDARRAEAAMRHLLRRLPDFPPGTLVSQNMGFNSDGNPVGEQDARPWAKEIAKTHSVLTWDFSLTEGENNVVPHWRFRRLFARRQEERAVQAYSGGICFTMTPRLNQLSLYESAQSFLRPHANPDDVAIEFFRKRYGAEGAKLVPYMKLFEVVQDWGNYGKILLSREGYHDRMKELVSLLHDLRPALREDTAFHPTPSTWHGELQFYAELFRDLSAASPDFDALASRYWDRVYAIYDHLPAHVDPRPKGATQALVNAFRPANWRGKPVPGDPGRWTET